MKSAYRLRVQGAARELLHALLGKSAPASSASERRPVMSPLHLGHCCPTHGCVYDEFACPVAVGRAEPYFADANGCGKCAKQEQDFSPGHPRPTFKLSRTAHGYSLEVAGEEPRSYSSWLPGVRGRVARRLRKLEQAGYFGEDDYSRTFGKLVVRSAESSRMTGLSSLPVERRQPAVAELLRRAR